MAVARFMHVLVIMIMLFPYIVSGEEYRKIGAGIAVQTGHVTYENGFGDVDGVIMGISARYFYQIRSWIRAGGVGAFMRYAYEDPGREGSVVELGYGGSMFEITRTIDKVRIGAGTLLGGGRVKNVHIEDVGGVSCKTVSGHKTFIVSPIATCEYHVLENLSLIVMTDYLFGPALKSRRFGFGPKIHIGALFVK